MQERIEDCKLSRVNLFIDRTALAKAQAKAIKSGAADVPTAGNASGFVRWLIDRYNGTE